jgi:hypothetical protein
MKINDTDCHLVVPSPTQPLLPKKKKSSAFVFRVSCPNFAKLHPSLNAEGTLLSDRNGGVNAALHFMQVQLFSCDAASDVDVGVSSSSSQGRFLRLSLFLSRSLVFLTWGQGRRKRPWKRRRRRRRRRSRPPCRVVNL